MKQPNTCVAYFVKAGHVPLRRVSSGTHLSGTQVVAQDSRRKSIAGRARRIEAAIMKNLHRAEQACVSLKADGGNGSAVIVSKDGLILTAVTLSMGTRQ